MAYYADLSPCDYFGRWQDVLRAVGWLEPGHPFATGPVPEELFGALVRLLSEPWQPVAAGGSQRCPYCRFTGGPRELRYEGTAIRVGANNLFVPASDGVHVAPSLIAHYIDAHDYRPPPAFQQAVLRCPEMRSIAYLKEIRARGLVITRPAG
ncbi:hypothetical protein [Sorangium sp. So ce131]|uniref:DUF7919 family protein n=1 Tax=Sorangium sp. So ce131 TaxID=3133282 RepID=UPI003F5FD805